MGYDHGAFYGPRMTLNDNGPGLVPSEKPIKRLAGGRTTPKKPFRLSKIAFPPRIRRKTTEKRGSTLEETGRRLRVLKQIQKSGGGERTLKNRGGAE